MQKRQQIERMTEAADQLLAYGEAAVYSMTQEALLASTALWQYKGLDGIVHGPFHAQQIAAWKAQGFLTGASAVMMRKVGKPSTSHAEGGGGGIYDEEGDVPDEAAKKRVRVDDNGPVSSSGDAESVQDGNEWVSSDSIDFGAVVNLDQDAMAVREAAGALHAGGRGRGRESADRGGRGRGRGVDIAANEARRKLGLNPRRQADGDEEDNEEEEDEEEGFGRRRRRRRGYDDDGDDDD